MLQTDVVLLTKKHHKKEFDCKIEALNDYLKKRASQDVRKKIASCFVLVDNDNKVLGYYTLSNASIPKERVPENIRKKIPYQDYPVTLLGRLAIDFNAQGNNYGSFLLIDALKRSYTISKQIASAAVVVDPINEAAHSFYKKYGFIALPDSKRMFLPMKTIAQLF